MKNKSKFEELIENKKGVEKGKRMIEKIMEDTTFEIVYLTKKDIDAIPILRKLSEGYSCRCKIEEKTKELLFTEVTNLEQLASLTQTKKKVEETKNLNKFIDLIENIKDILEMVVTITNKGFPMLFHFEIIVCLLHR